MKRYHWCTWLSNMLSFINVSNSTCSPHYKYNEVDFIALCKMSKQTITGIKPMFMLYLIFIMFGVLFAFIFNVLYNEVQSTSMPFMNDLKY